MMSSGRALAGGLTFLEAVTDGGGVDGLAGSIALAVTGDGAHLYVAGADDDAVAVFRRDAVTGLLTFVEVETDGQGGVSGLRVPSALALSPDGAHLYATGKESNALVVFARDAGTGALAFVEVVRDDLAGVDGLDHPSGVAVSPDGANVYATGEHDDAVAVFSRDLPTGALTFVEVQRDGVAGVDAIDRPSAVTVSPDGANLYVAGGADDGLAVFSRAPLTGALTYLEAEHYGDEGQGIDRPNSIVVTSDGASLYVAGHDDRGVAGFVRHPATGALTFVTVTQAPPGLDGLRGAFAVAASPDGGYVYVAAENDHAVTVLRRNAATSALTFVESQRDGRFGVGGLRRASAVAASADGAHVYAVGHDDDAVVAFAVDRCGNGAVGTDEECDDGNLVSADGCSAVCRLELCGASPAVGCRRPIASGAALLTLLRKSERGRDGLTWRWTKGEATSLADYGHPATTAGYALCLYDASAVVQPLLALAAPAGGQCAGRACWSALTATSLRYKDKWRTPDGLTSVHLHAGFANGDARVIVSGRGENLALPSLPLTAPVLVQLRNTETGVCWEATYGAPIVNDDTQLKSKSE
jgi:cysteine-rich repeat protein